MPLVGGFGSLELCILACYTSIRGSRQNQDHSDGRVCSSVPETSQTGCDMDMRSTPDVSPDEALSTANLFQLCGVIWTIDCCGCCHSNILSQIYQNSSYLTSSLSLSTYPDITISCHITYVLSSSPSSSSSCSSCSSCSSS